MSVAEVPLTESSLELVNVFGDRVVADSRLTSSNYRVLELKTLDLLDDDGSPLAERASVVDFRRLGLFEDSTFFIVKPFRGSDPVFDFSVEESVRLACLVDSDNRYLVGSAEHEELFTAYFWLAELSASSRLAELGRGSSRMSVRARRVEAKYRAVKARRVLEKLLGWSPTQVGFALSVFADTSVSDMSLFDGAAFRDIVSLVRDL